MVLRPRARTFLFLLSCSFAAAFLVPVRAQFPMGGVQEPRAVVEQFDLDANGRLNAEEPRRLGSSWRDATGSRLLQCLFAIRERSAAQVDPIRVQEVKHEIDELAAGIGQDVLQGLKAAPPLRVDDAYLAIKPCGFDRKLLHGARDRFKRVGPFFPVARDDPRFAVFIRQSIR